jgi:hypothetical protein
LGLGEAIYRMCSFDSSKDRKAKRMKISQNFSEELSGNISEISYSEMDLPDVCIHPCYSADLSNWIRLLIEPDRNKRPGPAETLA